MNKKLILEIFLIGHLDNAFSCDLISHRTPLSPQSNNISASDQLCIRSRKNHKFYDLEYKTKIVPLRENFLNLLKGPKRNGNRSLAVGEERRILTLIVQLLSICW